jgi:pimeloyl-[acyl-carrier protein] methyl ester esterase
MGSLPMGLPISKLVLLPGLDGTGELFRYLIATLPPGIDAIVVSYPRTGAQSYEELLPIVRNALPKDEPYVLIAESFSSPLAIQIAAIHPDHLVGLVLCAGFAARPVNGFIGSLIAVLAWLIFLMPMPKWVIRNFLVGKDASKELTAHVQKVIESVPGHVLAARMRTVLTGDARKELSGITVPMTYLQAAKDHLVWPSSVEIIRSSMPAIKTVHIDGPHLILQREPEQSSMAIQLFLSRLNG